MNHIYRVIWNAAIGAWQAVAENTPGKGKTKSSRLRTLAAASGSLLLSGMATAGALPTGGNVIAGEGSISQNGNAMTINQGSDKLAVNWQSFSIGQENSVTFNQPSASSVALNRVLGNDVSLIQGALNANGQVFLVNPNGVLFTPTAQVNVGGIVASTLDISTDDFMAGNYSFEGSSSNAIINQGNITAHGDGNGGGTIALIAAKITNQGSLTANSGQVLLGAGSKVMLDLGGPVKLEVQEAAIDALIEQGGAIKADGGLVYLTAKAAGDLASTVINHTGITEAQTLASGESGEIYLMGDMQNDMIAIGGTLDASAPNGGNGGFVETSAASVQIADGTRVTTEAPEGKAGEWLIDPYDFNIVSSSYDPGYGYAYPSYITEETLENALKVGDVRISTANGATPICSGAACQPANQPHYRTQYGDINVGAESDWDIHTLTLSAYRHITFDASMNGHSLVLEYGQGGTNGTDANYFVNNHKINLSAGDNFFTKLGSNRTLTYRVITSLGEQGSHSATDLQGIAGNLSLNYALGGDIDASATAGWNEGASFDPLGNDGDAFTGHFAGLGHSVSNLTINRPDEDNVGLIGVKSGGEIRDLTLTNAKVTGRKQVGAMVGNARELKANIQLTVNGGSAIHGEQQVGGLIGEIDGAGSAITASVESQVTVQGRINVGGLVGDNVGSTIHNGRSDATVTGIDEAQAIGGLVGRNSGTISGSSQSSGTTTGQQQVGGLVGVNSGTVSSSSSSSQVTGIEDVGGLVGLDTGTIQDSDSSGQVTGTTNVGGLVGEANASEISSSSSSSRVSGTAETLSQNLGGLVGLSTASTISTSSASGQVEGTTHVGGLVGWSDRSKISVSHAIGQTTGLQQVGGLIGRQTEGLTETSYATGNATGTTDTGGLVGLLENDGLDSEKGKLYQNYANGHVTGQSAEDETAATHTGGLVGRSLNGTLDQNYATGNVKGATDVGGLIGRMDGSETGTAFNTYAIDISETGTAVSNSYAIGSVTGLTNVAGLVGNLANGRIATSHAAGVVTALPDATPGSIGGLVGLNADANSVTNSYWDIDTTGQKVRETDFGTGLHSRGATINAYQQASHAGFDFGDVWYMSEDYTRAFLRFEQVGTTISDAKQLQLMGAQPGQAYTLGANLDLSGLGLMWRGSHFIAGNDTHTDDYWTGGNFGAIGRSTEDAFTGTFHGNGRTIRNLKIDLESTRQDGDVLTDDALSQIGLFGVTQGARIERISLQDVQVRGKNDVGALTGLAASTTVIRDAHVNGGMVIGELNVGGLVGRMEGSSLEKYDYASEYDPYNHASVSVRGTESAGGLVGALNADSSISHSYATSNVEGIAAGERLPLNIGGLVGSSDNSEVTYSYAAGNVRIGDAQTPVTGSNIGGLVGSLGNGSLVAESFSTASVVAGQSQAVGGLAGAVQGSSEHLSIRDSYATGEVFGKDKVGGLVGKLTSSKVVDTYASGSVTGATLIGGLVGARDSEISTVSGSFWNTETTGQAQSAGGSGKTTKELMQKQTYAGWDIYDSYKGEYVPGSTIWRIYEGNTAPLLRYFMRSDAPNIYVSKTYDGDRVFSYNYDSKIQGTLVVESKNAGTYRSADTSGLYSVQLGYDLDPNESVTATINRKALTGITGITAASKTYDATRNATVNTSGAAFSGMIAGDDLLIGSTGDPLFANKHAGKDKTVTISDITLDGADAENYSFNGTATATATITKANIDVTDLAAQNRTYDGTNKVAVTGIVEAIGNDQLILGAGIGSMADKHAGQGKAVTFGSFNGLSGADAGNYNLIQPTEVTGLTVDIAKKGLSASGITADARVYDTNTGVTLDLSELSLSGLLESDELKLISATGSYADKHVGHDKIVTVSDYVLDGADKGNYEITSVAQVTGTVTQASLTVGDISAIDRTYNGTTAVGLNGTISPIGLDDVTLASGTGQMDDKDVGEDKAILTASYTLAGDDAHNYALVQPTDLQNVTVAITKATIERVLGITADKTYDGTTTAPLGYTGVSFDGMVSGDDLNVADASGAFADKNAGTGKAVSITGLFLGGADARNYLLADSTASITADIDQAEVRSVSGITAIDRTYDATTAAQLELGGAAFDGMIEGDRLEVATATGVFSDKNVDSDKAVSISGIALGGDDAGNYLLVDNTASATASIAKADLHVDAADAEDRTYDGTRAVDLTGSVTGLLDDRLVLSDGTGVMADKHAGLGKAVTATGFILSGADADNYNLILPVGVSVDIARATIDRVKGITASKVYDSTLDAPLDTSAASFVGRIGDDVLKVADAVGVFDSKNVGIRQVSISDVTLGGTDARNYVLADTTATTLGAIEKADLQITGVSALNRNYNGTVTAALSGKPMVTGFGHDDLSVGGNATAYFNSAEVGLGKRVTVEGYSLLGADAANYSLLMPAELTADITRSIPMNTAASKSPEATQTGPVSLANTPSRNQELDMALQGSLRIVEVNGSSSGSGGAQASEGEGDGADAGNLMAGLESGSQQGFMNVFAVDGGIRMPNSEGGR